MGGAKAKIVFALLVLSANRVVTSTRILDALWGEEAPDNAVQGLRVHVSRIRKALGDESQRLVTEPVGYRLRLAEDEVDADRFAREAEAGRRLLLAGEPRAAGETLRGALELWRGPALADFVDHPFATADIVRLEEARLAALEDRIEADLATVGAASVAAELEALCTAHPLRERLWAHRIIALYRSGRQADALRAYQSLRENMVEELGIEPRPELRRLEQAVLDQDPSLDSPVVEPSVRVHPDTAPADEDHVVPGVRLMLVDDHPLWREAMRATLERKGVATVVAEAEDGQAAVEEAERARPDVVLMDLHMPTLTGAEATRAILERVPTAKILMLSSSGEEADVLEAVRAGAHGYLLKTSTAAEVADAIRRVAAGEAAFEPSTASIVLGSLRAAARAPVGAQRRLCTIVFVDVVESTQKAIELGDGAWRELLERYHVLVSDTVVEFGGQPVKTVGDGVLATFDQPTSGIRAAVAVRDSVHDLGLVTRAGLHMGECEMTGDDVHGLAVNIASRVSAKAAADEVLVSQTVRDLVLGSGFVVADRGSHALRGIPDTWRLFAVEQCP